MKVGFFGGTFNPPHMAHLIVAETVREQAGLDMVLWMPAGIPPHKPESRLVAPEHRLRMTELATADNPYFRVSDMELRREGVSYTVDTIRSLQEENPAISYALIIGGDSLRDFPGWHRPEEILERVPLVVYRRGDGEQLAEEPWHRGRVRFAEAPLLGLSSTEIRARLAAGLSIKYLVSDPVLEYIEANGLYRSTAPAVP